MSGSAPGSVSRGRLGPDDWIAAGLAALGAHGPDAVAIEPIAASLGATKGSGYWHFRSRAAFLDAVLGRWEDVATSQVIAQIEASGGSPERRIETLLGRVTASVEQFPGELLTLSHLDPVVRAAVQRVTVRRIAYVESLLIESGIRRGEAHRRALLAYAAYLGYAQLAATVPDQLPSTPHRRAALQRTMTSAFTVVG